MKRTEQKVLKFIDENSLIEKGDRVLIALSGGPDSVFLLHILKKFESKLGISLGAVHINHMIRGKAAKDDEVFCVNLCLYLGIELAVVRKNVRRFAHKNKISVEEAGRILRYREFSKECLKSGYTKIATAHNSNDNAETILLNLIKGAGIKGLSGIPVKRGKIIRPTLNIKKEEILDYLKEKNIRYQTDFSNLSNDYERNFIRNEIIPAIKEHLNPNLEKTLFNTSGIFYDSSLFLEEAFDRLKNGILKAGKDQINLSIKGLEEVDKAVVSFGLRSYMEKIFAVQSEFNDIKKIYSLKNKQPGRVAELSNKIFAVRNSNEIIISIRTGKLPEEPVLLNAGDSVKIAGRKLEIHEFEDGIPRYSGSKLTEYISADNISGQFMLRTWKIGEKFYPIGFKGTKKISDFLKTNRKFRHQ